MAVGDLTGDGRPELVIADQFGNAVMVYRNTSTPAGGPCYVTPPPPTEEQVPVATNPPAVVVPTPAPTPTPTPAVPRTCSQPGSTQVQRRHAR